MPLNAFRPGDDAPFWAQIVERDEYHVPKFDEGDVVLDLGLSIGAFTQRAWDQGSRNIFAYEACPDNFRLAAQNVGGFEGVKLYNKAVVGPGRPRTLSFQPGLNSFFISAAGAQHAPQDVRTTTLDEILRELGPVRFMKVDIEGSEWEVLFTSRLFDTGSVEELVGEYHQPCETWPGLKQNPYHPSYDWQTLERFLIALGFRTRFQGYESQRVQAGSFRAVR